MNTLTYAYIACAAIIGTAVGFVLGACIGYATARHEENDQ